MSTIIIAFLKKGVKFEIENNLGYGVGTFFC